MVAMNILLGTIGAFLLLGVIAEEEEKKHENIVIAFCVVLVCLTFINVIR